MRRPKYLSAIGNGSVRPLAASIAAINPARVTSSKPDSKMIALIAAHRSLALSSAFSVLAGVLSCGIVCMFVSPVLHPFSRRIAMKRLSSENERRFVI
jgi:hypothetical protein